MFQFQSLISPALSSYHPLQPNNFTDDFEPTPYVVSPIVERYHNAWRFGHSNNFTQFVNGVLAEDGSGNDEVNDYVEGVIMTSLVILIISLVWAILILIFKCLGPKRVGFLSGRLIQPLPIIHSDAGEKTANFLSAAQDDEDDDTFTSLHRNDQDSSAPLVISNNIEAQVRRAKVERKFGRKVKIVKSMFLLCGLGVIISGALYYGIAVDSFNNSFDEVRVGTNNIRDVTLKGLDISNSILADEEELRIVVDAIQVKLPQVEELCLSEPYVGDYIEPIIKDFKNSISSIEGYSDELRSSLSTANDAMEETVKVTHQVDDGVDTAQRYFIACVWISSFFFLVVVAMLLCSLCISCGKNNCFTMTMDCFAWPVFALLLFLVWVFASLFLATSLSGSDICVQPDDVAYSALVGGLGSTQDGVEHAIYLNLVNYITGCSTSQGAIIPDEFNSGLLKEISDIHSKSEEIMKVTKQLSFPLYRRFVKQCGLNTTDVAQFQAGAEQLHNFSHNLYDGYLSFENEILSCSTMNPIYTSLMHDAFCSDALRDGMLWIYTTTLCVAIFSMMMAMFRSAMYPIKVYEHS